MRINEIYFCQMHFLIKFSLVSCRLFLYLYKASQYWFIVYKTYHGDLLSYIHIHIFWMSMSETCWTGWACTFIWCYYYCCCCCSYIYKAKHLPQSLTLSAMYDCLDRDYEFSWCLFLLTLLCFIGYYIQYIMIWNQTNILYIWLSCYLKHSLKCHYNKVFAIDGLISIMFLFVSLFSQTNK